MHFLVLASSALALANSTSSFAQSASPAPQQTAQGDVSLTIYNDDLALVQDKRQLSLRPGRTRQEFPDVSAQIRPETVSLAGDGIEVVEQNFDFDLLSPAAMMEKAVGETVTLVRVNPATGAELRERALVLAANEGVVVRIGDRIEVLRDDGLPVRVVFDKVPPNLRARPTLSVTLESPGGTRPVTLSYLTPGLTWKADYVALFDENAGKIDVQGWVTLSNNSGTSYSNADTLLVAGAVQQVRHSDDYEPTAPPPPPLQRPGTESANRARLGDFYLYPLPARTTVADKQTKQVSFLDVTNTPARKAYEYRVGWLQTSDQPRSAASVLKFSTSRSQGLGDALPAGTVRVYMRDQRGQAQFIGENRIGHTPMGSELALRTGDAFDVKVRPLVEERTRVGSDRWRTRMAYLLTNARAQPVTVELIQDGLDNGWEDTRVTDESVKGERLDADSRRWLVQVPANGEARVSATFDTRY
jgi:hypothetical protein